MSSSKPLSSLTVKCLLKYLDPSLRLQLPATYRSIQHLEKSVPLHIKYLKLTDNTITVNQSTYQLTVFAENKVYQFDINQNGMQDLGEVEEDPTELRIDVRHGFYTGPMNVQIAQLMQLATGRQRAPRQSSGAGIQLKIRGRIEVLSYQRKMHEAMKYLLGRLFGGKTVNVDHLAIGCKTILRVPSTLKLGVQNLEILDVNIYSHLETVCLMIEASSLPLSMVKIRLENVITTNNSIERTTRMLYIQATPERRRYGDFIEALARQRSLRVHVESLDLSSGSWYMKVFRCWLSRGKEIGTYYTFGTTEETINRAMVVFGRVYGSRRGFDGQITINLKRTSQVVIRKVQKGNSWILGMEVESR